MANMFSEKLDKKIPREFCECYKLDDVTKELWSWSARLERWGNFLFWGIIVIGLVLAIKGSIEVVEVEYGIYYKYTETETRFDFFLFFVSILKCAGYAWIEYIIYHVIAILIGSLASIVQSTKISADVALYMASNELGYEDVQTDSDEHPSQEEKGNDDSDQSLEEEI